MSTPLEEALLTFVCAVAKVRAMQKHTTTERGATLTRHAEESLDAMLVSFLLNPDIYPPHLRVQLPGIWDRFTKGGAA